jgi:uncharacterized protein YbjT (DUF2867 family)
LLRQLRLELPYANITGTGRQAPEDSGLLAFDPFSDDWSVLPGPFDVVINCIGAIRENRDMSFDRIHAGLTELILDHRAWLGHPRLVQVSALGAREDHPVAFLRSKGQADALLLTQPDTLVVRPSVVCHPETVLYLRLQKLLEIARLGFGKLLVPKGFGRTRVQPVLPADLSALLAAAVIRGGEGVVDAVGGEVFSFRELLEIMATSAGRTVRLVEVPREIMEGFVKYFVSVWFPGTLNYDQFQLLFMDNTGEGATAEALLMRPARSTREFWQGTPPGEELVPGTKEKYDVL